MSNHAYNDLINDGVHVVDRNTLKVRLEEVKQNGMVLHHHLDSHKNISEKINVDQAA